MEFFIFLFYLVATVSSIIYFVVVSQMTIDIGINQTKIDFLRPFNATKITT